MSVDGQRLVLSREAGQFGDGLVKRVGDALAEKSPVCPVASCGEGADAVGVGLGARLDHFEELSGRCRPAIDTEEPLEPTGSGREVSEPLGGGNMLGVQGTQAKAVRARSHCGVAGPA